MSKHKALELAEKLRTRNGNASGFGLGPVCDEAEETIRAQHALIVQMREALDQSVTWVHEAAPHFVGTEVHDAIAAADQYLGEQA